MPEPAQRTAQLGGFVRQKSKDSAGVAWYDSAVKSLPTFRRHPLLLEFLVVGVAVALAHYAASQTGLYYAVGATDVAMHFFGGLWIGLAAILVFFTSGMVKLSRRDARVVVILTLGSVLAVGLAWEVYEFLTGLADPIIDRLDTLADLAMDFLGGCLALGYFRMVATHDDDE
jgi:hypothetical protein